MMSASVVPKEQTVSDRTTDDGHRWLPAWGQALTDFRGEDDEPGFDNVTVRMTVPASIGGIGIRAELSNRFGDHPVRRRCSPGSHR
jgi:hypothetical protein